MKTIYFYIFFFTFLICLVGCKGTQDETNKSEELQLSWDCEYVTMSDDKCFATINLKDKFLEKDTFDAHRLIGDNYLVGQSLDIKIESDAEIVRAEKVTHFYPTIWAGENDNVIQFIYLFDMEYRDVLQLTVTNNVIKYPSYGRISSSSKIHSYFAKITKEQITSAIEKVPDEYQNKHTLLIYEHYLWGLEKKVWNRIAKNYTPGEFVNSRNEPFEINPYEIELVVTFKGSNGEFTKIFQDEAIVGN